MTNAQVENRRQQLLHLLHLPLEDCQVGTLSGGQQRRLSLAMALIHQPPILILDEPTVGVDPLVRQRVWEHILELSRDRGTTTIITTHYVEEARGAAKVGFMREGRLLAEDSPAGLLQRHSSTSLEGVFLSLCQAETNCSSVVTSAESTNSLHPLSQSKEPLCSNEDAKEESNWTCSAP